MSSLENSENPQNTAEKFLSNGWNSLQVDIVEGDQVVLSDVDTLYPSIPDERFNPESIYMFATSADGKGFYKSLGRTGEGLNEAIDKMGGEQGLDLKVVQVTVDGKFRQRYP